MKPTYDEYYQTENLFGDPYPELIDFFAGLHERGKVLDLGCGQGRNAIALARLGDEVTGVDCSKVGINQMNRVAQEQNLKITGLVGDINAFDRFAEFDVILLDSMFHFAKKDRVKEMAFIANIISKMKKGGLVVVCIQDTGDKVQILNKAFDSGGTLERLLDRTFIYVFEDDETGNQSKTNYRMIVVTK